MVRKLMIILVMLCVVAAGTTTAAQGTRMADKEVKKLMETIEKDIDLFKKAMGSEYRKAVLKSPSGEVDIEAYLKNLKDLAKKMKGRFDSKNAANGEVLAFLKYAQPIQARHDRGDSLFGAEKEWPRLSGDMERLGAEYGIRWKSSPDYWKASRLNDKELKQVLESFQKSIGNFRKDLDKAAKKAEVPKAQREKVLDAAKRMEDVAKDVKKAVDKGTDASGALALLKSSVEQAKSFIAQNNLEVSVGSSWADVERNWGKVRSGFNLSEF